MLQFKIYNEKDLSVKWTTIKISDTNKQFRVFTVLHYCIVFITQIKFIFQYNRCIQRYPPYFT